MSKRHPSSSGQFQSCSGCDRNRAPAQGRSARRQRHLRQWRTYSGSQNPRASPRRVTRAWRPR